MLTPRTNPLPQRELLRKQLSLSFTVDRHVEYLVRGRLQVVSSAGTILCVLVSPQQVSAYSAQSELSTLSGNWLDYVSSLQASSKD